MGTRQGLIKGFTGPALRPAAFNVRGDAACLSVAVKCQFALVAGAADLLVDASAFPVAERRASLTGPRLSPAASLVSVTRCGAPPAGLSRILPSYPPQGARSHLSPAGLG